MQERRDDERVANVRARGPHWKRDFARLVGHRSLARAWSENPHRVEAVLQSRERQVKAMSGAFGTALLMKDD